MIGALVSRFGAPLLAQAAIGLGIALVLAVASLSGMTYLYLGKRDELATERAAMATTQDANDSQQRSIDQLRAGNAAFAKACVAKIGERDTELSRLHTSETAARALASKLDRDLRRLAHEDPTVDAWLRAPVPGPLADRLRRDATGGED